MAPAHGSNACFALQEAISARDQVPLPGPPGGGPAMAAGAIVGIAIGAAAALVLAAALLWALLRRRRARHACEAAAPRKSTSDPSEVRTPLLPQLRSARPARLHLARG